MVVFKVKHKDHLRKIHQCPECDSGDLTLTTLSWSPGKPADEIKCRFCGWKVVR